VPRSHLRPAERRAPSSDSSSSQRPGRSTSSLTSTARVDAGGSAPRVIITVDLNAALTADANSRDASEKEREKAPQTSRSPEKRPIAKEPQGGSIVAASPEPDPLDGTRNSSRRREQPRVAPSKRSLSSLAVEDRADLTRLSGPRPSLTESAPRAPSRRSTSVMTKSKGKNPDPMRPKESASVATARRTSARLTGSSWSVTIRPVTASAQTARVA
jgi:hypothetical protein